jgi:hypothetical protein
MARRFRPAWLPAALLMQDPEPHGGGLALAGDQIAPASAFATASLACSRLAPVSARYRLSAGLLSRGVFPARGRRIT